MIRSSLAAVMLTAITGSAMAAPVVYDRGLPTANLNDAAGANRSNVAWGFDQNTPAFYAGDDFTLGAGTYRIDTVRTWAVIGGVGNTSPTLIADRYSSIALYGGSGPNLNQLMSGNTVGNGTNNANISITKVQYAGGADYESFGNELNLYEVTFSNLNWVVDGSVQQFFSVAGVDNAADAVFRPWFMSASNAALGGSPADGADDLYSAFFDNGGTLAFDSTFSSLGNGWDKASDINVQIEAERLPEPGSLLLFGLGLIGLTAARRTRH
jgi:hypothetical protein